MRTDYLIMADSSSKIVNDTQKRPDAACPDAALPAATAERAGLQEVKAKLIRALKRSNSAKRAGDIVADKALLASLGSDEQIIEAIECGLRFQLLAAEDYGPGSHPRDRKKAEAWISNVTSDFDLSGGLHIQLH